MIIENEILERALEKLRQEVSVPIAFDLIDKDIDLQGHRMDGIASLRFGNIVAKVNLEVKEHVSTKILTFVASYLMSEGRQGLLVTRELTPQVIEQCQQIGLWCIDMAGNAYISHSSVHFHIQGKRLPFLSKETIVFQAKSLRIVFLLLARPELLNASYRELSKLAGVSLGTVSNTMKGLEQLEYIEDRGRGKKIMQKRQDLVRRWVEGYLETLRPKLLTGRYTAARSEDLFDRPSIEGAFWAGELEADRLGLSSNPQHISIFIQGGTTPLVAQFGLRHATEGEVELLKTFWLEDAFEHSDSVPLILTYAELMATGDPRNIEIAERLNDKYLE